MNKYTVRHFSRRCLGHPSHPRQSPKGAGFTCVAGIHGIASIQVQPQEEHTTALGIPMLALLNTWRQTVYIRNDAQMPCMCKSAHEWMQA